MRCDFCGKEFDETDGQKTCTSCRLFGGCMMVKCPYCGYETPKETRLLKWIRQWRTGRK